MEIIQTLYISCSPAVAPPRAEFALPMFFIVNPLVPQTKNEDETEEVVEGEASLSQYNCLICGKSFHSELLGTSQRWQPSSGKLVVEGVCNYNYILETPNVLSV